MLRLLLFLLVASITFSCGGNTDKATTEEATTDNTEETTAVPEEEEPQAETTETVVLNPNLAAKADLAALPGMSEDLAQTLIDNRPYLTMQDFQKAVLTAADEKVFETVLPVCFVPMNLNTTAEDDFKMIPGVGDKMAHEFEEYRPYKKLAQFRREMGKYVDDAEIARYENYVFVPVELNTASKDDILALPGVGDKMAHEFEEYRPYQNMAQFRREIGKYVDEKELARLERLVYLNPVE